MLLTNCANILAISLRKVKKIRRYLLSICAAVNKRRALLPKRGALQVVKTKTCLWYFCGQMRNRRGKNNGDFQFWWKVRGSNPRPRRCEKSSKHFFALFLTIYIGFRSVSLYFCHSLGLKSPCATPPSVVRPVVKNAPRPLPVPFAGGDKEHFSCL